MRRSKLILLVGALLAACGGDSTSTLEITVSYPNAGSEAETNSVHYWVVEPQGDEPAGCKDLIAGDVRPHHTVFVTHADLVVLTAEGNTGTAGQIPQRDVIVYVEAVDFRGVAHLVGCLAMKPSSGTEMVTVTLTAPGTYDCSEAGVADGSPCDDGVFCTVGETCNGGQCGNGGPRDCTYVADECNAEACSEELGCHPTPVPNGRPCEDGDYCTVGDSCQSGACTAGGPRDCSSADAECRTGRCDETLDRCVSDPDDQLTCTDSLYCTQNETCSSGFCLTDPVDCSIATNDCNIGSCSEAMLGACVQLPTNGGGSCDTNCTLGGTCSSGLCTGGTPQTPGTTEGPSGDPSCSDFIDNDCDGDFDSADTDCQ